MAAAPPTLRNLLAAVAGGIVDAQTELDETGRDSIDAFEQTGVPPTVLTWSTVQIQVPVSLALRPKRAAGGIADSRVGGTGDGQLTCRLRYLEAPQGIDDPRPEPVVAAQEDRS
jgi:hypothetical protein